MASYTNADPSEIDRYDKLSHTWWDTRGEMRTLHTINPLRTNLVMENIGVSNPRILDVGCGGGILTEALAKAGAQLTGIDLSQASIQVARQHAQGQGLEIDYRYGEVELFTQAHAESFDGATCMEMLEHVPQPEKIVAACSQALKPAGQAFFSTITRTLKAFLFAIVIGEYFIRLLPRGSHQYKRLIRFRELENWASENDLEFVRLYSLIYNPLNGRFKLAPDKEDVEYVAHFIKRN